MSKTFIVLAGSFIVMVWSMVMIPSIREPSIQSAVLVVWFVSFVGFIISLVVFVVSLIRKAITRKSKTEKQN